MKLSRITVLPLLLAAVFAFTGCKKTSKPQKRKKPTKRVKKNATSKRVAVRRAKPRPKPPEVDHPLLGKIMKPKAPTGDALKQSNACVGATDAKEPARTFKVGGTTYTQKGASLVIKGSNQKRKFVVGLISSVNAANKANANNWKAFIEKFKADKVDMVIALGDLGSNFKDIRAFVLHLGHKQPWSLAVIPGNKDKQFVYNSVVAQASKLFPNLIDLSKVRHIKATGIEFVTLPGYYSDKFTVKENGCVYKAGDLKALAKLAKKARSKVALISHGPPKGSGKNAIDYAVDANVGDAALTKFIKKNRKVRFGLFAHIQEAGGQGVGRRMKKIVKEGKASSYLFVNGGSSHAAGWKLNNNKDVKGMAMVVTFSRNKASYKTLYAGK